MFLATATAQRGPAIWPIKWRISYQSFRKAERFPNRRRAERFSQMKSQYDVFGIMILPGGCSGTRISELNVLFDLTFSRYPGLVSA
jgi:hypothetical protein